MTHKSRRSPSLSRHLLDSSFADVDEWLKLQLTAKEGSWRMFGSLKKKISIRLSSEEKKKSNKNQNALAAVSFCPAMGWRVHRASAVSFNADGPNDSFVLQLSRQ